MGKNFFNWFNNWKKRLIHNGGYKKKSIKLMKNNNPIVIPRNHKVEEALINANEGNLEFLKKLLLIIKNPYEEQKNISEFQVSAQNYGLGYQTFCGT